MNLYLIFALCLIGSYLLGNLSPSTLLARMAGKDIKSEGSGNAGTTNALRVLGKKAALITLIVDVGKGILAVYLSKFILSFFAAGADINPYAALMPYLPWCALAVFLGHVWPILLKFQGGKGVATAFGAVLALDWRLALLCLGIVAVVTLLTRMVSAGSVTVAICFPFLCLLFQREMLLPGLLMALLLIFKHRENIKRIAAGTENKLFGKKKQ